MEYGNTIDSKDISTGSNSVQGVLTWSLNKLIDLNGNYMEYEYFILNGQRVIKKIRYTGNVAEGIAPYNEVEFQYTERQDKEHWFVTKFGKGSLLNNLLDKIIIKNDGNHYKTYRFQYGYEDYSMLKNIVEEGGISQVQQFIPLEFVYGASRGANLQINGTYFDDNQEFRVGDFNGDGVSDLLRIYRSYTAQNELQYDGYQILINDNGVFVENNYTFVTGRILQYSLNGDIGKREGIGHFMLGDFDGDGKTDITYSSVNRTNNKDNLYLTNIVIQFSACLGNSVAFVPRHYGIPDATYKFLGRRNNFIVGDFDGDGAQDLYLNLSDGHKRDFGIHHDNVYNDYILKPDVSVYSAPIHSFHLVANSNSSRRNELHQLSLQDKVHVIDMNGDGIQEIMQIMVEDTDNRTLVKQFDANYNTTYVFVDDHQTTHFGNWPHRRHILRIGDFNGDGKTDIMATSDNDKVNWDIKLSDGQGFKLYKIIQKSIANAGDHVVVADFDADGKSDILHSLFDPTAHPASLSQTKINILYSRKIDGINEEISFKSYDNGFAFNIQGDQAPYLLDYDGDGGIELMASKDIAPPFITHPFHIINPTAGGYGSLIGVSTGFAEFTAISYESISRSNNQCRGLYKKGTGATYPNMDFHKPLFVVNTVQFPDQSGMNGKVDYRINNKYFYEGAKLNLEGKGFLGFTKTGFEQEYIGGNEAPPVTYSETEYEFNFNLCFAAVKRSFTSQVTVGACIEDRLFMKNISSTENTYAPSIKVTPGGNSIYFNRLLSTISGDNLKGRKKWTGYNYTSSNSVLYGNPDQIVEIVGDAATSQVVTTTDYTYGQFGTHIPANVIAINTTIQRDNLDPAVEKMVYNFDSKGKIVLEQRTDNAAISLIEKSFDYSTNNFGLATTITETVVGHNKAIRSTEYIYDLKGRYLIEKINPLGYSESWTYDPISGGVASFDDIIDGNPLHTFTYDEFHRKKGEIDTYGNTVNISRQYDFYIGSSPYEPNKQLFSELVSSSLTGDETTWYDHLGRVRKTESFGFNQNIYAVKNYFSRGMVKETYEPFTGVDVINKRSYAYDEFGRNTEAKITDANGIMLSRVVTTQPAHTFIVAPYTYTNRNITTTVVDLSGKSKSVTYDPTGAMVSAVDDGGTLQYVLNSFGKQVEIVLNGNTISTMKYDDFGFQTELQELNSGVTKYTYNILGELTYQKDANQNITDNIEYDELGRMLKKTVNSSEVFTYTYNNSGNGIGQIDSEESQSNGISNKYYYNSDGNMIQLDESIQGKIFTTKYSYLSGRLVQEEYNKTDQQSATILDYKFTSSGYLSAVENANGLGLGNNFYTCFGKNEKGLNTSFDRVNLDIMSRSYSNVSLPTSYSSSYHNRDFVFDNSNGNLLSRKGLLPAQDESFLYDIQERLTETQLMAAPYVSINYDANGNISDKTDIGTYSYHPTKKNALMEVTNILSQVQTSTQDIEYDAHHNPVQITEGDMEWVFEYGPNHQRKKATIRNLNDGTEKYRYYTVNAEYEYDADDVIIYQVDYVSGDGELVGAVVYDGNSATTSVYAIYTDYLGSIELVTDELGNTVADLSYDAWGMYRDPASWTNPQGTGFQPNKPGWLWRGYTGHEHMEEFQLINMNGRLYDPLVGRMLSPDNYVQDNTSSQNFNRYSYVFNNPLKYTDPTGELTVNDVIAGAAIVGGVVLTAVGVPQVGVPLIVGGSTHFINTLDHMHSNGASWNDASNEVGLSFSVTINFNSNNGGKQKPINTNYAAPIPSTSPTLPPQNGYASINDDLGMYFQIERRLPRIDVLGGNVSFQLVEFFAKIHKNNGIDPSNDWQYNVSDVIDSRTIPKRGYLEGLFSGSSSSDDISGHHYGSEPKYNIKWTVTDRFFSSHHSSENSISEIRPFPGAGRGGNFFQIKAMYNNYTRISLTFYNYEYYKIFHDQIFK
jgi:RHS repeat-associated protein